MMGRHVRDAWETVAPPKDNPHGPLPALLVILTVVTGLVDAFSYLGLGRVFVANMTGNVVFLSFALGGAEGFVWWASILAIGSFLTGAFAGGRITARHGGHRGRHLLVAASAQAGLVVAALAASLLLPSPYTGWPMALFILLLGLSMGLQNATARALGVPDMTTTALTLTLTGISADSHPAGGKGSHAGRRLVSVASMFTGGLIGALLCTHGYGDWVLAITALLLIVVVALIAPHRSSDKAWTQKPAPKK